MQHGECNIFLRYCLNTIVYNFNTFKIGTVNAVQKEFKVRFKLIQIKSSLLLTLVYSYFSFHLHAIQLFISTQEKSYEHIDHSPPHVSVITENILIVTITFAHYHLLLASNSTVMTDSQHLSTIEIWRNLNEHHYYLTSTKPMIFQRDANCSPFQSLNMLPFHIKLESLKLI